jgi:type 1 fimbria pilin
MKHILLTTIAMIATFAVPAVAETPNRVTMSFPEFVAASGCEIRPNASGQLNLYATDGGNCPSSVLAGFTPVRSSSVSSGPDGILGTSDDVITPGDN